MAFSEFFFKQITNTLRTFVVLCLYPFAYRNLKAAPISDFDPFLLIEVSTFYIFHSLPSIEVLSIVVCNFIVELCINGFSVNCPGREN